jgi:DNA-binding NarL/FixJ family response regulator
VLTPHEREIIGLVGRGFSNRQIAEELDVAEKTAIHLAYIRDKLGVHSRAQLVVRAAELRQPRVIGVVFQYLLGHA